MKKIFILFIYILLFLAACKTQKPAAEMTQPVKQLSAADDAKHAEMIKFSDQTTWLLGYFNPARLSQEPYSSWYLKGFDEYTCNTEVVNKLLEISKENISIKIVMGTWCPDSRREVPRFMRILNIWQFPVKDVTFIGVDDAKLSPVGEYASLDIQRVPTFIIYKNNVEAGRIIENPVTSLEQDMVNILTKKE